ncbi:MAG: hypothetical protein C4346_17530 [Chloroflexota bacterium]
MTLAARSPRWIGGTIVVESHGEPVAAVVPLYILQSWERERQAFFDHMREVSVRSGRSDEEAASLVAKAIDRVREQG